jgi:hypothetical protein
MSLISKSKTSLKRLNSHLEIVRKACVLRLRYSRSSKTGTRNKSSTGWINATGVLHQPPAAAPSLVHQTHLYEAASYHDRVSTMSNTSTDVDLGIRVSTRASLRSRQRVEASIVLENAASFAMSTEFMSHVLRSTERNAAAYCMQSTSSFTPSLRVCLSVAILTSVSGAAASRVRRLQLLAARRRTSRPNLKSRTYRWKYHALRRQKALSRGKSLLLA